jgi:hypothetical protein
MRHPYASIAVAESTVSSPVTVSEPSRNPTTTDHTRTETMAEKP